jgi:hypothetical protein
MSFVELVTAISLWCGNMYETAEEKTACQEIILECSESKKLFVFYTKQSLSEFLPKTIVKK